MVYIPRKNEWTGKIDIIFEPPPKDFDPDRCIQNPFLFHDMGPRDLCPHKPIKDKIEWKSLWATRI